MDQTIAAQEIHIWRINLRLSPAAINTLKAFLSEDDLKRAARFRLTQHRQRFIAAHGALRWILSRYLAEDPAEIQLTYNAYRKPALSPAQNPDNLAFNLTHSADHGLVAISRAQPVGIDLEKMQAVKRAAILRRYFSPVDVAFWESAAKEQQMKIFYQLWVRKEALGKAIGEGLSLSAISVSVMTEVVFWANHGWQVVDIATTPGFQAALAAKAPIQHIHFFDFLPL